MLPAVIAPTQRRAYNRDFWSDRFSHRTGPVWNRLGPIHEASEGMTAYDAMDTHGLIAPYTEVPAFYEDPRTGIVMQTGNKVILRSRRDGSHEYMATVDNDFEVIQPADIATLLDAPVNGKPGITSQWPVDLIGTQKKSAGFFITLHAGGCQIAGDEMQTYFIIRNGNDGSTALTVGVIHIRLACWNTMTVALKGAMIKVSIPHRRHANEILASYTQMIHSMPRLQSATQAALEKIASKHMTADDINAILDKTFAIPSAPQSVQAYAALVDGGATIDAESLGRFTRSAEIHGRKIAHIEEERRHVLELHQQFNDTNPRNANTGWSIFNAITDLLDNKSGKGETDDRRDDAAADALFGHRARMREIAYQAIASR